MLADCLHGLTALAPHDMAALMGAMLLAGLAGSVTHCAGMCGPFVIAQIDGDPRGGRLARLSGAALLPYHLGRAIGYSGLGAVVGGAAGLLSLGLSRGLLAIPLVLAALVMLGQAATRFHLPTWMRLPHFRVPGMDRVARLLRAPPGARRSFLLGLMLSAIPCGLLYGALAAAMAAGSALAGALAMLAFVTGTVPALVGVALLGRFFGRRFGSALRMAAGVALVVNGGVLLALAARVLGLT